jgi:hypothetical protein
MKRLYVVLLVGATMLSSCDLLKNATDSSLSNDDIVNGLKTALKVGADSSVSITSAVNGYAKDAAIKILLPPEAKVITDNVAYVDQLPALKATGIDLGSYVDKAVLSMNRAAESAAKDAAPILKNSITSLSITDGLTILQGKNPATGTTTKSTSASFDSTAATNYLVSTTRSQLVTAYATPINTELDKDLGLGISSNAAWKALVTNYNILANAASTALAADIFNLIPSDQKAILQKFTPITQTTLGEYVTGKALDGLFIKVGDQERSIRKDPWKWITSTIGDILTKVFGS